MTDWYEARRLNFIQFKIKNTYGDTFYKFSESTRIDLIEAFQQEYNSWVAEQEKENYINVEFLKLSCERGLSLLSKSYSFWEILKTLVKQKLGV